MQNESFPIQEVLPDLRQILAGNTRLVLEAPPGAHINGHPHARAGRT